MEAVMDQQHLSPGQSGSMDAGDGYGGVGAGAGIGGSAARRGSFDDGPGPGGNDGGGGGQMSFEGPMRVGIEERHFKNFLAVSRLVSLAALIVKFVFLCVSLRVDLLLLGSWSIFI